VLRGRAIAVVIPAYNEADKIAATIRSIPGFVDHVIVVDDGSADATAAAARRVARRASGRGAGRGGGRRVEVVVHAAAVMAGDGQMDPADLPRLLAPVLGGEADYAKGNRLGWPGGWRHIPPVRLLGNLVLSYLTRLASGYRRLLDTQSGYTVAARPVLALLTAEPFFPRYGYPNDVLIRLGAAGARVVDVPVRPIYGPTWRSGLRPARVALPLLRLLARAVARRLSAHAAARRLPAPAGAAPAARLPLEQP